ncbi:MAG: hypothetical protein K2Q23_11915 [Bryobacteraceae bacterium]|nr:hypothetical protein [Bryobacteraceae bacterium]
MKRFLLWDYPRASWQYDVMVALILAFIFLTPREIFRDQPRPSHVAMLEEGKYFLEPEVVTATDPAAQIRNAQDEIQKRYRFRPEIRRVEPIRDAEGALRGFMATTRP